MEKLHELLNNEKSKNGRPVVSPRSKKLDPEHTKRVAMYAQRYDNCQDLFTGEKCHEALADRERIDGFDIHFLKQKGREYESASSSGAYRMGN